MLAAPPTETLTLEMQHGFPIEPQLCEDLFRGSVHSILIDGPEEVDQCRLTIYRISILINTMGNDWNRIIYGN
ncbi:MAG: hypothetical protein Ct9H90mP16_14390 [Candidatus Poseidoniales archaeon]|nr:MAG: hypothetical protein Ct9H90mP16_14390 [Candidatus Poseidoniales archaeon]